MKTSLPLLPRLFPLLSFLFLAPAGSSSIEANEPPHHNVTWSGSSIDHNWGNPLRWSGLPGGYDYPNNDAGGLFNVTISNSGTQNVPGDSGQGVTIRRLIHEGGLLRLDHDLTLTDGGSFRFGANLTGPGSLTLEQGESIWEWGEFSGAGAFVISEGATFGIQDWFSGNRSLNRPMINHGTIHAGGRVTMGAGLLTNAAGATFTSHDWAGSWHSILNEGTLDKLGAAETHLNILGQGSFTNRGVVNIYEGTLRVSAGPQGTPDGSWNVAPGATLRFNGGIHPLGDSSLIGAGKIESDNGTQITTSGPLEIGHLQVQASNVTLNNPAPEAPRQMKADNFTMSGGTVTVNSQLQVGGLTWSVGTLAGAGEIVIPAEGVATISPASNPKTLSGTVRSGGSTTWSTAQNLSNGISGNGHFINEETGAFEAQVLNLPTGPISFAPRFTNHGFFSKTESGVALFSGEFNNHGTIHHNQGTLALSGGGALGGTISIEAPDFELRSGIYTAQDDLLITAGANDSGWLVLAPTIGVNHATLVIGSDAEQTVTVPQIRLRAGTIKGPGTLQISNQATWNETLVDAGARLLVAKEASLDLLTSNNAKRLTGDLTNQGEVTWTTIGGTGAAANVVGTGHVTNETDGSFSIQTATTFAPRFTNHGSIVKVSAGTTTFRHPQFASTGSIQVDQGILAFNPEIAINGAESTFGGRLHLATGSEIHLKGSGHFPGIYRLGADLEVTGINDGPAGSILLAPVIGQDAATLYVGTEVGDEISLPRIGLRSQTLQGPGTLKLTEAADWHETHISAAARVVVDEGAILTLVTSNNAKSLAGTLTNHGRVIWVPTGGFDFARNINGAGHFINQAGGVFEALAANTFSPNFTNAGTFVRSGTGSSVFNGLFTNEGTVQVKSGTLTLANAGSKIEGELSSKWMVGDPEHPTVAAILNLPSGSNITSIASGGEITLAGVNAGFSAANGLTLNNGDLRLLAGSNFTRNTFTNVGQLRVEGGIFHSENFINSGTISGFGSFPHAISNSGTITADGPAGLTLEGGLNGASGELLISDDSNAAVGATSSTGGLHLAGGELTLGSHAITVHTDYTNTAFGSGNDFNPRAGVTGSGEILAPAGITQILQGAGISNGDTATPILDFGAFRTGGESQTTFTISHDGPGTTVLRGAVKTTGVNNSSISVHAVDWVAHPGGESEPVTVSFESQTVGELQGQSISIINNFDNVADQTLSLTARIFRPAQPEILTPSVVDFGIVRLGDAIPVAPLSIHNSAPADGFSERLTVLPDTTGDVSLTGSISLLGPDQTSSLDLQAALDISEPGPRTGSILLAFQTDGRGNPEGLLPPTSGLEPASLDVTAEVSLTATVHHWAAPQLSLEQGDVGFYHDESLEMWIIDFGIVPHQAPPQWIFLELGNEMKDPDYQDRLRVEFVGTVSGKFGLDPIQALPIEGIAPGGHTGFIGGLQTSETGTFFQTFTINLASVNEAGSTEMSPLHIGMRARVVKVGEPVVWGSKWFDARAFRRPITEIVAGGHHNLARTVDGKLVAWGRNNHGQSRVPPTLGEVRAVAANDLHTIALRTDGTLLSWGHPHAAHSALQNLTRVTAVAAGSRGIVALRDNGRVTIAETGGAFGESFGISDVTAVAVGKDFFFGLDRNGVAFRWIGHHPFDHVATEAVSIAAGDHHYVILKQDGTVVTVGDAPIEEDYGQFLVPVGLNDVIQIAAGAHHTLALTADGTVVGWGMNDAGQASVPEDLGEVIAIAAGRHHSLALTATGQLIAWGDNQWGQSLMPHQMTGLMQIEAGFAYTTFLGQGGSHATFGCPEGGTAVEPPPLPDDLVQISSGSHHTIGLRRDGTVVVWQDFDAPFLPNQKPYLQVPLGLRDVAAVSAGYVHNLALKNDGTVIAWGLDNDGQATVPPEAASGIIAISAGAFHNVVLRSDGTIFSWGWEQESGGPVGHGVTKVSAGINHSVVLQSSGTAWAWGDPSNAKTNGPGNGNLVDVQAGGTFSLLRKADGSYQVWGFGPPAFLPDNLQESFGTTVGYDFAATLVEAKPAPAAPMITATQTDGALYFDRDFGKWVLDFGIVPVGDDSRAATLWLTNLPSPAPAQEHLLALIDSSGLSRFVFDGPSTSPEDGLTAGEAVEFVVSLPTTSDAGLIEETLQISAFSLEQSPMGLPVAAPLPMVQVVMRARVLSSGQPVIWGTTRFDSRDFQKPLVSVTAGARHNLGINTDGTLVAWGNNSHSQIQPPQNLGTIIAAAGGEEHSILLRSDGSVVTIGQFSAARPDLAATLSNIKAVAAGPASSAVVRTNGTIALWGTFGSIIEAEGVTGAHAVALTQHRIAVLRQDGSFGTNSLPPTSSSWGWTEPGLISAIDAGDQFYLLLTPTGGVFTIVYDGNPMITPVDVGTGVSAIAAGANHCLALKADGTVVAWGDNSHGQCNVPADLADVIAIAAGKRHSVAIKSDGAVVTWGANETGETLTPDQLHDVALISAGTHQHVLVRSDGTVLSWGPVSDFTPPDLNDVVGAASGHTHGVVLRKDGTVTAWGYGFLGQVQPPFDLRGVTALSSGAHHTLALKNSGEIIAWGSNSHGQSQVPQHPLSATAVAAAAYHSVARFDTDSFFGWGDNSNGQIPYLPQGSTPSIIQIATGSTHTAALRANGTVTVWPPSHGPAPHLNHDFVEIALGNGYSFGRKSDGSVIGWGSSIDPRMFLPAELRDVIALSSKDSVNIALIPPVDSGNQSPYQTWAGFHGLTGEDAAPLANPARDGLANLLKFAFNLDPKKSDAAPIHPHLLEGPHPKLFGAPRVELVGDRLRIYFIRPIGGNGVTVAPLFTGTLAVPTHQWTPPQSVVVLDAAGDYELCYADDPSEGATSARFGRVVVTVP